MTAIMLIALLAIVLSMAFAADPQTLTTLNPAMRERWLRGLTESFRKKHFLINRLERKKAKVSGKHYLWALHKARNFGSGPRPETGTGSVVKLPSAGHQEIEQGLLTRAHYYVKGRITGAAIAAAADDGAVLDIIRTELDGAKNDMRQDVSRDMYGDGSGAIATVAVSVTGTTIELDSVRNLYEGMPIIIGALATGAAADQTTPGRTITAIDEDATPNPTITVNASITVTATTDVVFRGPLDGYHDVGGTETASSFNAALVGFEAAIADGNTYAGIDRTDVGSGYAKASVIDASALALKRAIDRGQDRVHRHTGGNINILICDQLQFRNYGDVHDPQRRWNDNVEMLDGGYKRLKHNGIEIFADPDCPPGTMYGLQEMDWVVLEEEGINFLDRHGSMFWLADSGDVDAWDFALVQRLQLACKNPRAQFKLTGLPDSPNT